MHNSLSLIGVGSPIVDAIALVEESFVAQIDGDKGGMVLVDAPTITSLIASLPKAAMLRPAARQATHSSPSHVWVPPPAF